MRSALKETNQLETNHGEHQDEGEEYYVALFETLASCPLDAVEQPV